MSIIDPETLVIAFVAWLVWALLLLLGAGVAKIENRTYGKALGVTILAGIASVVVSAVVPRVSPSTPLTAIVIALAVVLVLGVFITQAVFRTTFGKALRANLLPGLVITILVILLCPWGLGSHKGAKGPQAKADVKNIENAIRAYYAEYGKLPIKDADQGASPNLAYWSATGSGVTRYQYNILDTLRAVATSGHDNAGNVLNPRKIVFLDTPSRSNSLDSNGNFRDPWGHAYYILLDTSFGTTITNIFGRSTFISTNLLAIITSSGPNGVLDLPDGSGGDDIVNFQ